MNSQLIARGGVPLKLDRERVVFYTNQSTWLLVKKYGMRFISALYKTVPQSDEDVAAGVPPEVEIKDMAVLEHFLHIGLLADAEEQGESLSLQRVQDFITPYTMPRIFNAVIEALGRDVTSAELPGKAEAAQSSPDRAATEMGAAKSSTLTTRSVRHTPAGGAGRSSGKRRRAS